MSKEELAIDIDEVLFPYAQEFALHHNTRYATELTAEHFTSYDFEEVLGTSVDEAIKRVYEFTGQGHHLIEPVVDAQDGVQRLKKHFNISLLTARHPQFRPNTEAWIERHFPGAFSRLIMIGHEQDLSTTSGTKAEVCLKIGAVALVDDSTKYTSQAVEAGVPGILFGNYPWNQMDELPNGMVRVSGWQELAEHFDV